MQELLSVIVPVYNVQNYLRHCVKSIINQTYKTVEVILVDDGSTDLSGVICDKLCEEDDRIRVIHKKNEGSICARYEGILQARSKYITFVDGDDWIKPDMYESLMKIATEKNVDMITSGYIIYWAKDDWKESKDDTFAPGEYTKQVLLKQLEYFYMTTVEMRKQKYHDRRQKGYVHLFPFNKVEKNSSIIIYGAGRVGHEYFDQIDQLGYCEIVLWVDKNYLNYQKEDICDISMIFEVEYDYIVIANASINVIRQIIQEMINLGISEKKIIY